ncbi:MAG: adenine nucleotide alpha hydrolase [Spirochaetales bacterium]|nr:adenine nucleotide alpha hydrolase [Spirochaetales bacterium]
MRFVKQTGKGINRFDMINDGDSIILGISGGKDSLALALALSLRKKWLPINYKLHAVHIDWREYPLPDESAERLKEFFEILDVPYKIVKAAMFPESFKGSFNCYLCSRNRKRILFDLADEWGYKKIALGHHLDDIVDTTLINLCFRGSFTTMLPVQEFFKGKLEIIRPMCEVPESMVKNITSFLELPVQNINCPFRETNLRASIKPIVRELSHIDNKTRQHIYKAFWKKADNFTDLKSGLNPREK